MPYVVQVKSENSVMAALYLGSLNTSWPKRGVEVTVQVLGWSKYDRCSGTYVAKSISLCSNSSTSSHESKSPVMKEFNICHR
jgi:hypothetical protein